MSLLREIQEATAAPSFKLADVLRKAKILAARLSHQVLKDWIEKELNGYGANDKLPPYRILTNLGSRGDFFGPFGMSLKNAPIPPLSLPQEFSESISRVNVLMGVSAIENIVEQANQSNTSILKEFWLADVVALFGSNIYNNMSCGQAWRDIPVSCFVTLLDAVRNSVLDFAIEIEAEAPEAGEAKPSTKPISDEVVSQIFYKCVVDQSHQITLDRSQINTNLQQELIMSENHSTNIQASRDISVSGVVASGDINGIVTNTITDLQTSGNLEALKLAKLLKQLQAAIEAETSLDADSKELALEQVAVLANEGKEPKKKSSLKPVKTAIAALKGIAGALPPATELVKECNELLPTIARLLGLG